MIAQAVEAKVLDNLSEQTTAEKSAFKTSQDIKSLRKQGMLSVPDDPTIFVHHLCFPVEQMTLNSSAEPFLYKSCGQSASSPQHTVSREDVGSMAQICSIKLLLWQALQYACLQQVECQKQVCGHEAVAANFCSCGQTLVWPVQSHSPPNECKPQERNAQSMILKPG